MEPHLFFFIVTLFLLVHFHGGHARQTPPLHRHGHGEVNDQDHLITMLFFHKQDLKSGNSISLYFHPTTNPEKTPKFLPKEISDSLPFSLSHLPSLLKTLQIPPNSSQSRSMAESLAHCEKPPLNGESKFCSTSLESMLDYISTQFGPQSAPKLITTSSRVGYSALQTFKMVEDPREIGAPEMIACHPVPFPYAVFYCHGQRGINKLYEMEMETQRDGERIRVRVLGMCHMDTSDWDPNHLAFGLLGIRPGEGPVCHAFPPDSLVWVPQRRSASLLETVV